MWHQSGAICFRVLGDGVDVSRSENVHKRWAGNAILGHLFAHACINRGEFSQRAVSQSERASSFSHDAGAEGGGVVLAPMSSADVGLIIRQAGRVPCERSQKHGRSDREDAHDSVYSAHDSALHAQALSLSIRLFRDDRACGTAAPPRWPLLRARNHLHECHGTASTLRAKASFAPATAAH